MKTTDWLDQVKTRYGLTSDYQLAQKLGITRAAVSKYRNGKDLIGNPVAITIAKLLEIPPEVMVVASQAERARQPIEKAVWESILQKLGGMAAALVLGLTLTQAPDARANLFDNNGLQSADYAKLSKPARRHRSRRKLPFPLLFLFGLRMAPFQKVI